MPAKQVISQLPIREVSWDHLKFPPFDHLVFENGAQLYSMLSNREGLCYFEMVFENGRLPEHKPLISRVCANQIMEGTSKVLSNAVVDMFDYYGANCIIHADLDFTVLAMSCLQKHFERLSTFVLDLITEPAFRAEDLGKAKIIYSSQLQHQLTEPDYVSYREFTAQVYGQDSVYGYNSTPLLIQQILAEDLRKYHFENYGAERLKVFYCGDNSSQNHQHLKDQIGRIKPMGAAKKPYIELASKPGKWHYPIENCAQLSLKIGCRTFKRDHPDFYGMYLLNTVLGDYFGSRLMKNIREDKGLTYDIHSTLDAQKHDGCFYISAELSPEQAEPAIALIMREIDQLKKQPIPESELEMVRNYLCGHLMRLLDGPFQSITFLKILATEYNSPRAFEELLHQILHLNPVALKDLATVHFPDDAWTIVTAGAGN
jgi:zinc protease